MTEKAQRTIHIKWVRSGIGFTYRQKERVRSLGLQRLNQVVERPDTAQTRGLVASIPHLVEIVGGPGVPAPWAAIPEYTLHPRVVATPEPPAQETADAAAIAQPPAAAAGEKVAVDSAEKKKAKAHVAEKAKKAAKPAKTVEARSKTGKDDGIKKTKAAAVKSAKPAKTEKK